MVALDRLAVERIKLKKDGFPDNIIHTIQSARRPSTTRVYETSWKAFVRWCKTHHIDQTSASILDVLGFLQAGLDKGLTPATLRRQVAALATVVPSDRYRSISCDPRIKDFLHGATNISPPTVHRYPSWDLPLVLQALTVEPFEPLASVGLKYLSFKVAFLLAITSARRVSELAALSIRRDLCIFHSDRVVMRLDPSFMPKINSAFHRSQELVLPDFCPHPRHSREQEWHTLDVRRALRRYLRRTESFRRTESLLVSFHPASMGQKVSSATIARWIRACIATAYDKTSTPVPGRVYAHSTRSAAASAAWATQAPLVDICRAATWTSPSPFIRHYKIDKYASAEASFGRRVLQQVHATQP